MIKLLNDSKYFDIIIRALSEVLTDLNIEHEIIDKVDLNDINNLYIICTTHEGKPLPKHYISYNMEQLTTNKKWHPLFFKKLQNAKCVWDYSKENIKILNRYKIEALHVPLGYAKCMEYNISSPKEIKHDFMFIGVLNDNRYKKLQPLLNIYYKNNDKFLVSNSCWGTDLIEAYNNTKICINLHFYEGNTILEVHRIIPMIINRVLVISEHSNDNWYDDNFKDIITFIDNIDDLMKKYIQLLKLSKEEYEIELDKRANIIKTKFSYINYINNDKVLNSLLI